MLDLIQKVKETPVSAKFKEQLTAVGRKTSVHFNPRYFFAYADTDTYISQVGGKKCFVIECDDEIYNRSYTTDKYYKITESETNQLLLPVELSPMLNNSKHNMIRLTMNNPYFVRLGDDKPFGTANISFKHDFINHLSVNENYDGTCQIDIHRVNLTFCTKTKSIEMVKTQDYSLIYNNRTGKVTAIDNRAIISNPYDALTGFFDEINASFLTESNHHPEPEYHIHHVFKRLISKHFLKSDYPLAISRYSYALNDIKDKFIKGKELVDPKYFKKQADSIFIV